MVTLIGFSCIIFLLLGYRFYARWIERQVGIKPDRSTPAVAHNDGRDFVPSDKYTLLGHHFSAIAGSGPIIGPILAAMWFGWGPALLWIVLGCVFIGGVHDYLATMASLRHDGKSIAAICREYMGELTYKMFMVFMWFTLCYVILVFMDLTVDSLAPMAMAVGTAADVAASEQISLGESMGAIVTSASVAIVILSALYGFLSRNTPVKRWIWVAIFCPLMFLTLWVGGLLPIYPSLFAPLSTSWLEPRDWFYIILLAYCFVASVLPVTWLLLPRGFLSSFLLYACLLGGLLGLLLIDTPVSNIEVVGYDFFRGFHTNGWLYPTLFVTVACGAVSGFHATVASGTTSKQIANERDVRPVSYLAMIIEGILAVLAVMCVIVSGGQGGNPIQVFSIGFGKIMTVLHIPPEIAAQFALLSLVCFLLTTLDTCTRLARYALQELMKLGGGMATLISLALPAVFIFTDLKDAAGNIVPAWKMIWPLFGAMNQLLAALTLLVAFVWLRSLGKKAYYVLLPMIFLSITSLTELFIRSRTEYIKDEPNYLIAVLGTVLAVFALVIFADQAVRLVRHWKKSAA